MSAAHVTAEPGVTPGPHDRGKTRFAPVVWLVRKLIDYGRDLVASLQQQNTPTPSPAVARSFGTRNLALIIARITRGLAIAAGLEARLVRWPPMQDRPPKPQSPTPDPDRPAASKRVRPHAKRPRIVRPPTLSRAEDDAALLRGLPTAEEIAARIRGRTAGDVIVEICRDLGIDTSHPLWPEIRNAILFYDGSLAKTLTIWMEREVIVTDVPDEITAWRIATWHKLVAESAGPP